MNENKRTTVRKLWEKIHFLRKLIAIVAIYALIMTIYSLWASFKIQIYHDKIYKYINENQPHTQGITKIVEPIELIESENFVATAYCPCEKCCGKTDGITKTGTTATEGRTIAVDPDKIPLGSKVTIDGKEYIAEDIGGAIKGNRIDIYFDKHSDALNFGRKNVKVVIGGV